MRLLLASAAMILSTSQVVPGNAEDAGDVAYGTYLAAQCASCHGVQGSLPSLDSLDVDTLAVVLEAYRSGERDNAIMQNIARNLGQRETAALKAHLAQREKGNQ